MVYTHYCFSSEQGKKKVGQARPNSDFCLNVGFAFELDRSPKHFCSQSGFRPCPQPELYAGVEEGSNGPATGFYLLVSEATLLAKSQLCCQLGELVRRLTFSIFSSSILKNSCWLSDEWMLCEEESHHHHHQIRDSVLYYTLRDTPLTLFY